MPLFSLHVGSMSEAPDILSNKPSRQPNNWLQFGFAGRGEIDHQTWKALNPKSSNPRPQTQPMNFSCCKGRQGKQSNASVSMVGRNTCSVCGKQLLGSRARSFNILDSSQAHKSHLASSTLNLDCFILREPKPNILNL